MIAYKCFDKEMTCRGFQYEEGKTYTMNESEVKLCESGFHACLNPSHLKMYYNISNSVIHKVQLSGFVTSCNEKFDTKVAASQITILEEISKDDISSISNEYLKSTYGLDIDDRYIGLVTNAKDFDSIKKNGIKVGNRILIVDGEYNKSWVCVGKDKEGKCYFMAYDSVAIKPVDTRRKDKYESFAETELCSFLNDDLYPRLKNILSSHIKKFNISDNGTETKVNISLADKYDVCKNYFDSNFDYFKYLHLNDIFEDTIGFSFWLRSVAFSTSFCYASGHGYSYNWGASNLLYVRPLIVVQ